MRKVVMIQPAKLGDLIVCIPIAKYYHELGHRVEWPVFDNFAPFLKKYSFIDVKNYNVKLNDMNYYSKKRVSFADPVANHTSIEFFDKFYQEYDDEEILMVDPCFAFPGHKNTQNIKLIKKYSDEGKNWIHMKYDLAHVPLKHRWDFPVIRNEQKEEELFQFIKKFAAKKYNSTEYSIVHSYHNELSPLPNIEVKNPINFSYIAGFEISDWLQTLENANNIVCVDSSLANFVEVNPSLKSVKKYYLGSEEPHFHPYMRNILLNNWINLSGVDLNYDGIGIG